ncbi:uncharacterized protein LOC120288766 [Eucalyptus grandis]|uniref:uncharacterized protein LOC120288766 n=1 Tax=Eucalyptus grandis TaxID=71139 RepID=UPI00192ED150|nr:uncharacterized protein LOC120288766 [Eucalyptus grandis]
MDSALETIPPSLCIGLLMIMFLGGTSAGAATSVTAVAAASAVAFVAVVGLLHQHQQEAVLLHLRSQSWRSTTASWIPTLVGVLPRGAKLTVEELESISSSFDESIVSSLYGLSPASASLTWFFSSVNVLTTAHSAVRSLIYELKSDGGDSLLSWYLDNSLKVLDVCNRMSSKIERLCLHHLDRRMMMNLLGSGGNPSKEDIHQARDLLVDSEGEGMADIEELIRDLATSIVTSAMRRKDLPVDKVVRRAVQAVNFLTAFIAGVIYSALCSSSRAIAYIYVPEEFPWGDSTRVLEELNDVEARGRHVLEAIDEVVASGGDGEVVGRLREAAVGLEKATEQLLKGLYHLRDGVDELFLTVTRIRKEMVNEFRVSLWKGSLPEKPLKPSKNN